MGVGAEKDHQEGGQATEHDDAGRECQPVASEGELAGEEAVLGEDRSQAREGRERGVGSEEEEERGERLEQVERDRPAAVDDGGHL